MGATEKRLQEQIERHQAEMRRKEAECQKADQKTKELERQNKALERLMEQRRRDQQQKNDERRKEMAKALQDLRTKQLTTQKRNATEKGVFLEQIQKQGEEIMRQNAERDAAL